MSAITIILLIIGYCRYFTATWGNYLTKNHKLYSKTGFCGDLRKLNLLHLTGIFLLGLPLFFLNKQAAIFLPGTLAINPQKLMVLSCMVLLTAIIGRKTAINAAGKLQAANNLKDEKLLWIYLPIRIIFLVFYELFFRGVLLAVCIYYLDIEWAILLNILLYTLLHFFSEKEELFFCPLFGAVLCLITVWFHSVLPALMLHITLSVSHEGYILKKIKKPLKHYPS